MTENVPVTAYSLAILASLFSQANCVRGVAANAAEALGEISDGDDELAAVVISALKEVEDGAWRMMDVLRCAKVTLVKTAEEGSE